VTQLLSQVQRGRALSGERRETAEAQGGQGAGERQEREGERGSGGAGEKRRLDGLRFASAAATMDAGRAGKALASAHEERYGD
jgi:hypothetical protein